MLNSSSVKSHHKDISDSQFTESLATRPSMPDESVCELLRIACMEVTERLRDDPMRAQIFWYASTRLANLQRVDLFRQLLCDVPDLGKQLCLWTHQNQPEKATKPNDLLYKRLAPESEYTLDTAHLAKGSQESDEE
jgi:hypothetical protein